MKQFTLCGAAPVLLQFAVVQKRLVPQTRTDRRICGEIG